MERGPGRRAAYFSLSAAARVCSMWCTVPSHTARAPRRASSSLCMLPGESCAARGLRLRAGVGGREPGLELRDARILLRKQLGVSGGCTHGRTCRISRDRASSMRRRYNAVALDNSLTAAFPPSMVRLRSHACR
jgi:hypothetical protein